MPESRRLTRLQNGCRTNSPRLWLRQVVFWAGAVLIAIAAIAFAWAANKADALFVDFQAPRPWVALMICPAGLVA